MKTKHIFAAAFAITLTAGLISTNAFAEDEGPQSPLGGIYLGGSVGIADVDGISLGGIEGTSEESYGGGEKFALRLDALWQACDYLGVELGYVKIDSGTDGQEPDGLHFSLLPTYTVMDKLAVFGRVGTLIGTSGDRDGTNESTHAELTYGAGVAYQVMERIVLRLEWEHFDLGPTDAETFWLGALFKLG